MSKPKHVMELFKLLDKSNCRKCGEKTCLAFAAAAFQGRRSLDECPRLPNETLAAYTDYPADAHCAPAESDAYLDQLKSEIRGLDLVAAAEKAGGILSGRKLTVKVLGKDFSVDAAGNLSSDIHITPFLAAPVLNYILHGQGVSPSGKWVTFRELKGGLSRHAFFQKRCEAAMKRVADAYTDLFDDLVHLFNGKQVARQFQSDISVVLDPLPKLPMMICYWLADEGMDSSVHVFFDQTADRNLDVDSIFNIGVGLATMFTKIARRHGYDN